MVELKPYADSKNSSTILKISVPSRSLSFLSFTRSRLILVANFKKCSSFDIDFVLSIFSRIFCISLLSLRALVINVDSLSSFLKLFKSSSLYFSPFSPFTSSKVIGLLLTMQ
ncbi:hypothetical protein D3C73_1153850 [compost metagenome]